MLRYGKLLASASLCAGFAVLGANGQPPDGRKAPPAGEGRRPDAAPAGEGRPAKPDPLVDAWVKTLVDKIADPHDVIRDSARAGLVAVGRPGVPMLRKLADGDDSAKATAARRVLEMIERGPMNPMMMMMHAPRPEGQLGRPGGDGGQPGRAGPMGEGGRPGQPGRAGNAPRGEGRPGGDAPRPNADAPRGDAPRPGDAPRGEARPRGPLEGALADLTLNEKQRKQVEEIVKPHREAMQALMEEVREGKLERPDAMKKREKLVEALHKEMKEILTAEQFATFTEKMKQAPRPGGPDRE